MGAMSCYRRDYVFTKPHFLFLLVGCLGDISQPPLQLGRAIWLSSGWWNAGRSDTFYTQALIVRTFPWDPPLVHPLPLSSPAGGYRTPHALFGSTYTTTGMIQRRLAWPCTMMVCKSRKHSIFLRIQFAFLKTLLSFFSYIKTGFKKPHLDRNELSKEIC